MSCWPVRLLGILLLAYSSVALLCDLSFSREESKEPSLCVVGTCGNKYLVPVAYQRLAQNGEEDLAAAVAGFREALARDTAAPSRWCDLGEALLGLGEIGKAEYCFATAVSRGPNSPFVLLRVANSYFLSGNTEKALQAASRILHSTSEFDTIVFSACRRFNVELSAVLHHVVSGNPRAGQSYLRYLLRTENRAAARLAWDWIADADFADDQLAGEYVAHLLKNRDYEGSSKTWARYLGQRRGGYLESNWLFNGDFESEPTGCRLDWVITPAGGVQVIADRNVAYSGARSLQLRFDRTQNPAYSHVSQTAYVKPGQYRFRGYIRTEAITTDQGVGFRIFDAEAPRRLDVQTEATVGTVEWRELTATFTVPQQTRLIEVQVVRRPSLKFDNQIDGTAWIDALEVSAR